MPRPRALVDGDRLHETLDLLEPRVYRDVELNERLDDGKRTKAKRHPVRNGRSARVAIAATTVQIRQTPSAHASEEHLLLNVVHVWEQHPPEGEPAVSWTLYTTEPIQTDEQLLAVVDYYRLAGSSKNFSKP